MTLSDITQFITHRKLRKRSPLVPVPFPIGDLTILQLKALKKALKKLKKKKSKKGAKAAAAAASAAAAAAGAAALTSGDPIPGIGSTIPLVRDLLSGFCASWHIVELLL